MPRRLPADLPPFPRGLSTLLVAALALLLAVSPSAPSGVLPEAAPALARAVPAGGVRPQALLPLVTAPATGGAVLTPERYEELDARVARTIADSGARAGIAVQDLRTGATFSHGAQEGFATASVAKLMITAMLVLHARDEGRELTAVERSQVEAMIRYSDNDVANGLYERIGYNPGFAEGAERLGFTGTEPHPNGVWGGTLTTPADQIRLLRALYTEEGPLTADECAHIRGLMETVAPEQAWGVSAAAGPGDVVGLKNGWTPRESDGGRWLVNSVGYVAGPDRQYLIAVMSEGSRDYTSGVALTEELVTAVTSALEDPPGGHPAGRPGR
ncbi:serine hydrolase [Nocardiopsis changdeensis]|uniref:Serine hydrolase n=1 Tax=Nocardiopsis changdeensis TaxID=2831969 RepID=A0ABX8BIQ4_9ACTN|nr:MULTISPECIES: serine hydrolase [Nocardiopsis]QUX21610.1 serine hydrolase [Nocardiopsis changdeensis]QYX37545.1 class A beta-lactamase-related serine hydrolase [Nocardiopsis sp. MT53]